MKVNKITLLNDNQNPWTSIDLTGDTAIGDTYIIKIKKLEKEEKK